jgi:hypothetical protein
VLWQGLRWLDFFVTFCIKTKSNGPLRPRADEVTSATQKQVQNARISAVIASYLAMTIATEIFNINR